MSPREHELYDATKRLMDAAAATVGLIISAPVQLATAALVLVTNGLPVLFRQARPGKDGVMFELVKFRTMVIPDEIRHTDAERLTRLGRLLRSSSLDELPTLWNVARGDMSLVGPRPLLGQYLERYSPRQARRHEVRPGVTGLAQVAGRNSVSWENKLQLDVDYIDSRSFRMDVSILLRTLKLVLSGRGVNEDGQATMTEFMGGNQ